MFPDIPWHFLTTEKCWKSVENIKNENAKKFPTLWFLEPEIALHLTKTHLLIHYTILLFRTLFQTNEQVDEGFFRKIFRLLSRIVVVLVFTMIINLAIKVFKVFLLP